MRLQQTSDFNSVGKRQPSMLTRYVCCACRAENGVTLEWSPDGRHLLTATVAPRLRVDNGFQIYRRVLQAQISQALPAVAQLARI